ncbi:C10 family peptidase [Dysgonomonas sp. 25]|uniref:C10 family peptidase n=1 Tax=Dysgonomonas sp. 25 TaxID=2302933 RepID=UPI0013D0FF6E|nr:C10 family peptidase [Dysgonomonas sp. 25]NDV70364.1 hypothetical protein [Dysgonomonas sp. 25]
MKKLFWPIVLIFIVFASCDNNEIEQDPHQPDTNVQNTRVSYDEALDRLDEALGMLDSSGKKSTKRVIANYYTTGEESPTKRSAGGEEEEEPFLYIFNFENNEGFAIISGDTRTVPVFAITESGNLPEGGTIDNPGMARALLGIDQSYRDQINDPITVPDFQIVPGEDELRIKEYHVEYTPWVDTYYQGQNADYVVWGQGDWRDEDYWVIKDLPYDDLADIIDGKRAVAGCVPTAVAQLCAYHKFPATYKGYSFDWNEMKEHRNFTHPNASYIFAYEQIAQLYAAISTKENLAVNFGLKESSAYRKDIPKTLKNLGFSNEGLFAAYDTKIIIEELKGKYPVVASGYSFKHKEKILGITIDTYHDGGHTWLIERVLIRTRTMKEYYEGKPYGSRGEVYTYVYCNWGWDGLRNGYYLSGIFDTNKGPENITKSTSTSGEKNHYKYKLDIIYNIRK